MRLRGNTRRAWRTPWTRDARSDPATTGVSAGLSSCVQGVCRLFHSRLSELHAVSGKKRLGFTTTPTAVAFGLMDMKLGNRL